MIRPRIAGRMNRCLQPQASFAGAMAGHEALANDSQLRDPLSAACLRERAASTKDASGRRRQGRGDLPADRRFTTRARASRIGYGY